jgi:hypothetical protein
LFDETALDVLPSVASSLDLTGLSDPAGAGAATYH